MPRLARPDQASPRLTSPCQAYHARPNLTAPNETIIPRKTAHWDKCLIYLHKILATAT
jgi:hypothetical protein